MSTNDLSLSKVLASLPQKGSNAFRLADFSKVVDKISKYQKVGKNSFIFFNNKNEVVLSYTRNMFNNNPKRVDISIHDNDDVTYLIDNDSDGKYDKIFKYSEKQKSRNEYVSTKDNDVYDELHFNVNDEKMEGYLIYHTMKGKF